MSRLNASLKSLALGWIVIVSYCLAVGLGPQLLLVSPAPAHWASAAGEAQVPA